MNTELIIQLTSLLLILILGPLTIAILYTKGNTL